LSGLVSVPPVVDVWILAVLEAVVGVENKENVDPLLTLNKNVVPPLY
jgi:hypothetical protein